MKHLLLFLLVACGKPVPKNAPQVAQCLIDNGTKMYGAFWCPHCRAQKETFGDGVFPQAAYVECSNEDRTRKEECGGEARFIVCEERPANERPDCNTECQTSGTCEHVGGRLYEDCQALAETERAACTDACNMHGGCTRIDIRGYPTWIFPNGERLTGEQSIQTLATKGGC